MDKPPSFLDFSETILKHALDCQTALHKTAPAPLRSNPLTHLLLAFPPCPVSLSHSITEFARIAPKINNLLPKPFSRATEDSSDQDSQGPCSYRAQISAFKMVRPSCTCACIHGALSGADSLPWCARHPHFGSPTSAAFQVSPSCSKPSVPS